MLLWGMGATFLTLVALTGLWPRSPFDYTAEDVRRIGGRFLLCCVAGVVLVFVFVFVVVPYPD
jgi:hypothetical protein